MVSGVAASLSSSSCGVVDNISEEEEALLVASDSRAGGGAEGYVGGLGMMMRMDGVANGI
jgi:hypothetical protein